MKQITILSIFFLLTQGCFTQIPIEQYTTEIQNLRTENDIELYWDKIYEIDQLLLVHEEDVPKSDSLSIDLMIRTTLLFQIHDTIGYNRFGNFLPVLNLVHSSVGFCQVIYWPVIEKCAALGGAIEHQGSTFPAYELESVSLSYYNYSLLNQELRYPILLNHLIGRDFDSIVTHLSTVFQNQKAIYRLDERKIIGSWINQPFTNLQEESSFEIMVMSDGNYYIKQNNRFQKLNQTKLNRGIRSFRIEKEPFGWIYRLGRDGSLVLVDDKGEVLISYTKSSNANTK